MTSAPTAPKGKTRQSKRGEHALKPANTKLATGSKGHRARSAVSLWGRIMARILTHNARMNDADGQPLDPHALAGVRVLDLSRILAGPWSTQTLADLGADVVKIERPGHGDDSRTWGPPFLADAQGQDTSDSAYYLCANRNKRSMCVDITQPAGQALVRELALRSDIVVENFKVGDLKRYGLDHDSLLALKPSLVICSVTGFGQTGPYAPRAGYDYAIQGLGGLMSITGERDDLPGGGPQKVGVAVADLFTGMYATVAILAALRHAERTGQGQHIDMALLDSQVAMLAGLASNYLVHGRHHDQVPGRMGNAHINVVPYQVFEVAPHADGQADHMILAVGNDGQFQRFCSVAGQAAWAEDPRFVKNADRVRHRAILVPMIAEVMRSRRKSDWLEALNAAHVPCGPVNNIAEVMADPHVQSRGMIEHWQHPKQPELQLVASPMKLSHTPVRHGSPPPLLGQHTDEVLAELLGWGRDDIAAARAQGTVA
jgi:crotonobetainyl-CoA:carnitine CoA-transferase CaiB-like acyl-CoA transferase